MDAVLCGQDSLPKSSYFLSSWWNGLSKVFQLSSSLSLILSQTHQSLPLAETVYGFQDCFIQQDQGQAAWPQSGITFEGSCLIHDSSWGCRALFFNSFALQLPPAQSCFLSSSLFSEHLPQ